MNLSPRLTPEKRITPRRLDRHELLGRGLQKGHQDPYQQDVDLQV